MSTPIALLCSISRYPRSKDCADSRSCELLLPSPGLLGGRLPSGLYWEAGIFIKPPELFPANLTGSSHETKMPSLQGTQLTLIFLAGRQRNTRGAQSRDLDAVDRSLIGQVHSLSSTLVVSPNKVRHTRARGPPFSPFLVTAELNHLHHRVCQNRFPVQSTTHPA